MNKELSIKNYYLEKNLEDVEEMIDSLVEVYYKDVYLSTIHIRIILEKIYDYYEEKEIIYEYNKTVKDFFEEYCYKIINNEIESMEINSLLNYLKLFLLLNSPTEINPTETKKVCRLIKKEYDKFERGEYHS